MKTKVNSKIRNTRRDKKLELTGVDLYSIYSEECVEYVSSQDEQEVIDGLVYCWDYQKYKNDSNNQ